VHDLHASQIATGLPVLSAHVVLDDSCFHDGHVAAEMVAKADPRLRDRGCCALGRPVVALPVDGQLHSPVIVPADMLDDWINPNVTDLADVRQMVAGMPEPHLVPRPVGKAVGSARNDGPQLVEPIEW
jgi:hypothetical protein